MVMIFATCKCSSGAEYLSDIRVLEFLQKSLWPGFASTKGQAYFLSIIYLFDFMVIYMLLLKGNRVRLGFVIYLRKTLNKHQTVHVLCHQIL